MARPEGFEPPAPRFVVWCSIQLSYGRAGSGDIGLEVSACNPRLHQRRLVLPWAEPAHREGAMAARPLPFPIALAAALTLAGCVSQGPFPSLAPRPEEATLSTAEPVRAEPQVADDAALRNRLGALVAQSLEGLTAFDAAYPAADRSTAAAGGTGSDNWSSAQQALSRLEAARSRTTTARAELDRIALERAGTPTSTADLQILERAITEAERITTNQQYRLDQLRGRISSP